MLNSCNKVKNITVFEAERAEKKDEENLYKIAVWPLYSFMIQLVRVRVSQSVRAVLLPRERAGMLCEPNQLVLFVRAHFFFRAQNMVVSFGERNRIKLDMTDNETFERRELEKYRNIKLPA